VRWNWILPRALLQIDLLLPSAEADRQVQVSLPEGVALDPSQPRSARAGLEIKPGSHRRYGSSGSLFVSSSMRRSGPRRCTRASPT
jgi:hypothetical protein